MIQEITLQWDKLQASRVTVDATRWEYWWMGPDLRQFFTGRLQADFHLQYRRLELATLKCAWEGNTMTAAGQTCWEKGNHVCRVLGTALFLEHKKMQYNHKPRRVVWIAKRRINAQEDYEVPLGDI